MLFLGALTGWGGASDQTLAEWGRGAMERALRERQLVGGVLAVVESEEIQFLEGFGHADLEKAIPVDPWESRFLIGSISKLFTAVALMQAVESGALDLYDGEISIWHLLTHTSGYGELSGGTRARSPSSVRPLVERMLREPRRRVFAPGTFASYTNFNFALAGARLEEATDSRYVDWVESRIFSPLGMGRSHAAQVLPAGVAEHLVVGYSYHPGTGQVAQPREIADPIPPGGILSTGGDMAIFAQNVLKNLKADTPVLSRESAHVMTTAQFANDGRAGSMGLGWWVLRENGQTVLTHSGRNINFRAGLWVLPEADRALFVAFNGVQSSPDAIWQDYVNTFHPRPSGSSEVPPTEMPLLANLESDRLSGTYHSYRFGKRGPLRLMNHALAETLIAGADGTLRRGSQLLHQTSPGVFENLEGGPRLFFRDDPTSDRWIYSMEGVPPVVRFPYRWWESLRLHSMMAVACLLVLVVALAAWLVSALKRKPSRSGRHRSISYLTRFAVVANIAALLLIYSGGGVLQVYYYGMSLPFYVARNPTTGAAIATVASVVLLFWKAKKPGIPRAARIGTMLLCVALGTAATLYFHYGWMGLMRAGF